jgi:hypothetical protein
VFVTEAGTPTTTAWFLRMMQRTGRAAKLPFPVHPHMLRHSTGYKLANDGRDTRLSRPQEFAIDGEVHCDGGRKVRTILERLTVKPARRKLQPTVWPFHHNRTFALIRSWLWKEISGVLPADTGK